MQLNCVVLFSWAENYHYDLNLQSIASYSMEQQASIVADYWLLINYGLVADLANVNYVGDTTRERSSEVHFLY